jgi:hypothetical protein
MPVSGVFDNLAAGSPIEEIIEQFEIAREQIQAVLEFAACTLDAPVPVGAPNPAKEDKEHGTSRLVPVLGRGEHPR